MGAEVDADVGARFPRCVELRAVAAGAVGKVGVDVLGLDVLLAVGAPFDGVACWFCRVLLDAPFVEDLCEADLERSVGVARVAVLDPGAPRHVLVVVCAGGLVLAAGARVVEAVLVRGVESHAQGGAGDLVCHVGLHVLA